MTSEATIFEERAEIVAHRHWPGAQHVLTLHAPQTAAAAVPGQFIHLATGQRHALRRPLSIMRAMPAQGWIEMLYKTVGWGTQALAGRAVGEHLALLGPIGRGFAPVAGRPRALLLGGGVGLPPMIFLAQARRQLAGQTLVLLGSEVPFPFQPRPSQQLIAGMPPGVIGTMPLLEDWNIGCRLASRAGLPGCHDGFVTDLARLHLDALDANTREATMLYGCGPAPMLAAVAALARQYALPCQLSLEEYMACAVGGCAGCVVPVREADGLAMRRVCVDGPVFDADAVYPG